MRVGERITALRIAAGMSQNELARRSGVPQTYISLLARGVNDNIGGNAAVKLADALHTTVDYLLTGRESESAGAWNGNDRRRALQETYRSLLRQAPNLDDQTLHWLDSQFAGFVEALGQDRKRLRIMDGQGAHDSENDHGSFKVN